MSDKIGIIVDSKQRCNGVTSEAGATNERSSRSAASSCGVRGHRNEGRRSRSLTHTEREKVGVVATLETKKKMKRKKCLNVIS